jgi:hypothetical protein
MDPVSWIRTSDIPIRIRIQICFFVSGFKDANKKSFLVQTVEIKGFLTFYA